MIAAFAAILVTSTALFVVVDKLSPCGGAHPPL
jgi:hypothetical protein